MFDVGFSEMLVIAVVALIVLGPERLPKAARLAGLWVRKARAQWYSVKAELEAEIANEQFRRDLQAPLDEVKQSLDGTAASVDELMRAKPPVDTPTVADDEPDQRAP
jgi:sec-independent protein translocase protein TatB